MVSVTATFYSKIADVPAAVDAAASPPPAHNDNSPEIVSVTASCETETADASTPVNLELAAEVSQEGAEANFKIKGNEEGTEEESDMRILIGSQYFDLSNSSQKDVEDASAVQIPES